MAYAIRQWEVSWGKHDGGGGAGAGAASAEPRGDAADVRLCIDSCAVQLVDLIVSSKRRAMEMFLVTGGFGAMVERLKVRPVQALSRPCPGPMFALSRSYLGPI